MPPTFVALLVVGFVVFFAARLLAVRRDWDARMGHQAATRGWTLVRDWFRGASARGEVDGCRVTLQMPFRVPDRHDRQQGLAGRLFTSRRERAWDYTALTVVPPRPMPLAFEAESSGLGRLLTARDLELGDPGFDDTVRVQGSETALRAAFDARTRWAVRLLVERGGAFDGRELTLAWQHDSMAGRDDQAIDCALEAMARLREGPGAARERLATIAGDDPKAGVRRGALACLVEAHRDAAETGPALERGLHDADPAVRVVAAVALDDVEALSALLAPGHPPEVRLEAVRGLAGSDAGIAVLRQAVARLSGAARAAAVDALVAAGGVPTGGLTLAEGEGGGLALTDG